MPSNHLILCHPLLLPSIFPSIRVFSNESVLCIRWPKYWNFIFSISLSNEYSSWFPLGLTGLISLKSKGLSSLVQHHSSKASILQLSALFIVQLSHPYMTTGRRGTDLNRDLRLKQDLLQGPEHMRAGSSWIHSSQPLWASLPLLLLLYYLSPKPELKYTIRHLNTLWTCMTDSGFTIPFRVLVWWNKPGDGVQDKRIPVLEGKLEHLSSYLILKWEVSCPSIKIR